MKRMGMYCKAYTVSQLRQFAGWIENAQSLSDDDLVYLQENHIVTKDIFIDEDIIFANVTPEWQDFCRGVLMFEPAQKSF